MSGDLPGRSCWAALGMKTEPTHRPVDGHHSPPIRASPKNDYLTFSCDCSTPSDGIWRDHSIDALDHDNAEQSGRLLTADWCDTCGASFHAAILAGETHRDAVDPVRAELNRNLFRSALAQKHARERDSLRHQLARRGVLR